MWFAELKLSLADAQANAAAASRQLSDMTQSRDKLTAELAAINQELSAASARLHDVEDELRREQGASLQQRHEFELTQRTDIAALKQALAVKEQELATTTVSAGCCATTTTGYLGFGPMAQCAVHALRSQNT